jgi:ribosomal protein L11 methyltransferase
MGPSAMNWSELCIHTTEEAIEPVTAILYEAGARGVVIEDSQDLRRGGASENGTIYDLNPKDYPADGVNVKAYLPINSFLGETVDEIKQSLNNLLLYDIDPGENKLTFSERNEEEWMSAWKKYYKPTKVGKSFVIVPAWIDYRKTDTNRRLIELDPGMAFGTGTHPTTALCIEALERYVRRGIDGLDVGTGTGVLSIAAAKLGAARMLAVDLDPVAVQAARLNVKINRAGDCVEVRQNNLTDNLVGSFDLIVGNLLADIVIRMLDGGAAGKLKAGGILIVSGIIATKQDAVVRSLIRHGLRPIEEHQKENWIAMVAEKRT